MKNKKEGANAHKSSENGTTPFWTITLEGKVKINQYKLIKFLEQGGFCKITTKLGKSVVRVVNNIVSEAPDHEMIDYIKKYLTSNKQFQVLETFSTGVTSYINKGKLNLLRTVDIPIDKDPKDSSWLYYQNTAVKITRDKIELVKYGD